MSETQVHKKEKVSGGKLLPVLLSALIIVLLSVLVLLRSGQISVGGHSFHKDVLYVELACTAIEDISPLLKLEGPEYMDLRGCPISPEDYRRLHESFPDCEIHWDVPLGAEGERYYNFSETIVVPSFSSSTAGNYSLMPRLKEIDLRGEQMTAEDYYLLRSIIPDCRIIWNVPIGGNTYDSTSGSLSVGDVKPEELELFYCFENLETLDCAGSSYGEYMELARMLTDCDVVWSVAIGGESYDCRVKSITPPRGTEAEELASALSLFCGLEELDLGNCDFSLTELLAVKEAGPDRLILADVELYGEVFSTEAEEIDLSGIKIEDTEPIEKALPLFHNLKKVVMSDCGISDEDMDALNRRHEDVLFVWTVHFSVYSVRTDATAFCASNVAGFVAPRLTDAQLEPIKYLTELEALDLGHMQYTDLGFLENMPKLRYLILVEARFKDISAIASLSELYYLELFNNQIEDISALLECRNLRHLNLGYTRGYDPEVLSRMTWLERLWCPGGVLSDAQQAEIGSALAETETYFALWDGAGSTGGGWREHESYFVMRDMFNMHYMPGGTGVPGGEQ